MYLLLLSMIHLSCEVENTFFGFALPFPMPRATAYSRTEDEPWCHPCPYYETKEKGKEKKRKGSKNQSRKKEGKKERGETNGASARKYSSSLAVCVQWLGWR